jgi:hypothetical protein
MRRAMVLALVACSSSERLPPAPPAPSALRPPVAATVAPDPAPPVLRLPGDVKPTSYALELTIVPGRATAAGRIRIAAEVVQPARVVWLDASGLTTAHSSA